MGVKLSTVQTKLPVSGLGLKLLTENRHSVDILQAHRHRTVTAVDVDLAEELQAGERGRLAWPAAAPSENTTCGPKVSSSALGPKVPALSGPATNSQNGSKS